MNAALSVGQAVRAKRVFTQADFDRFAALSGDDNPIHVDPQFAAGSKFGRTVAHGMFLYSVMCGVMGTQLPGPGTLQLEQELMFPSATYAGEEVTILLDVTRIREAEGVADLSMVVARPTGDLGLQGSSVVRLPGSAGSSGTGSAGRAVVESHGTESLKGLTLGHRARSRRVFTSGDLAQYAELTGDTNPVHSDAVYARRLGLAGPLVPGGLLAGQFSALLGTRLPGRGTNYLKQRLEFLAPAYAEQELTSTVEIIRIRPEKQLINLSTLCMNPAGETVCRGEALVLVSDVGGQSGV
jgi:acyl dehydratase